MKARWYFCTLVIILTFFAVTSQQETTLPNQEIVVQFSSNHVTFDEAQNTIDTVKNQLAALGIDNIQVNENVDKGTLIISYYSDKDVESVKELLNNSGQLALDLSSYNDTNSAPIQNKSSGYDLDVFKIKNGNDTESGFDGTYVQRLKTESDRLLNFNVNTPFVNTNVKESKRIEKVAYKLHNTKTIAIDFWSHNIQKLGLDQ